MADPTKLMKLLEIAEKFGIKRSKVIGTQGNIVPFKKPSLTTINVDQFKLKNSIDEGSLTMDKVKQEMEETVKLALSNNLNDVELNRALNNAINIDRQFFPPTAEVIEAGSGKQVTGKGLEELIQKQGTRFPPTTDIGKIEAFGKKLEKFVEETSPEYLAKQEAERKAMIARQYEGKGYAGGVFGPSGMYRSVARDFLLDQNAKGNIKLNPETVKALEERSYISGSQPLMYPDPIRVMRYHYGDDVFEKIPLDKIPTGARSEILDVMSKVEAAPVKIEPPKTPGGYLTPGEYKANIEELKQVEDAIKRRESRFADMTEEEIQNELSQYGGKRSAFEMGLEYDYPEEFAKYKTPKKPEPEEKADGGIIGYAMGGNVERQGMFFGGLMKSLIPRLMGIVTPVQSTTPTPEIPLTLLERYQKHLSQSTPGTSDELYNQYKKNVEGKADGGRIGYAKGKRVKSSIDKLLEDMNKKLSKKKSMETVNPKTGEVTTPKKTIRKTEEPTGVTVMDQEPDIVDEKTALKNKSRQLTRDEIADYEEQLGDSETWLSEGTVEEAEKALKRRKSEEAYYYGQYKMGKLDPAPGEQTEARMKFLQKKLEEAELTKDRRLITPNEINELNDLENIFAKTNEQTLENEMNKVLNQYDKSIFIKDEQGRVDVSNPANAEKMALLLKRDHPEIYNKIFKLTEDLDQKQMLNDFDITGRKPNSDGGIAGLL